MAMNKAWLTAALIAATLLAPDQAACPGRPLALDGRLARAEPMTLRHRPSDPWSPAAPPQGPGPLALGADIITGWKRFSALPQAP
jgi:hypothetical protein